MDMEAAGNRKEIDHGEEEGKVCTGISCTKSKRHGPEVLVIGAGISGLAAACELKKWCKVTVLESRGRIGGRIHTDFSNGYPVDMGASWLHGACERNPLASLIGKLHLRLYKTSGDNSVLYDHDLESYALFDTDGQKIPAEVVSEVGQKFEALLEEAKSIQYDYQEDISISEAFSIVVDNKPELRLHGLAYKVLQWYICRMEGWFAADADKISLRCCDEEELLEGGHGLMVDSYSPVLSALAEGLDIRLNERVTRIKHDFQAVEIHTDEGKVFHADAIIITVPLGVLKANLIKFDPKLPDWKEAAISDLGAGNENKIALFFDSVCWPNVEFLGVVAPTSYGCSYFLNVHKATGHPVLMYMPAGSLADDLEKLSDEAAASFAISQLKKILPHSAEPVRYLVSHWGSEIDSLGSYCYAAVGRPLNLYSRIRSRVENLFFAGEATSSNFPSTVHGAFDTGLMAAYECRRSFEESNPYLSLFQPVMAEVTTSNVPLRISRM